MNIQEILLTMRDPKNEQGTLRDAIAKVKPIILQLEDLGAYHFEETYNVDLGATTAWILAWKLELCRLIAEKLNCKYLHQNRTAIVCFTGEEGCVLCARDISQYLIERIRQLCNAQWNAKGKNKVKNERKFREAYYNGAIEMIREAL